MIDELIDLSLASLLSLLFLFLDLQFIGLRQVKSSQACVSMDVSPQSIVSHTRSVDKQASSLVACLLRRLSPPLLASRAPSIQLFVYSVGCLLFL